MLSIHRSARARCCAYLLVVLSVGACAGGDREEPRALAPANAMPTQIDGGSASAMDAASAAGPAHDATTLDARATAPVVDAGRAADATTLTPVDAATPDAAANSDSGSPVSSTCGSGARNATPFGCKLAWGTNEPEKPLANAERLPFMTKWVGYEVDKQGTLARCDGCGFVAQRASGVLPVYYAYFIGFLGSANGFADQNVNPNGPNLATDGAALIRMRRAQIVEMYAWYARETARAVPNKPVVWLLEGDFVQYTYKEQKSALSMVELAQLARDITCAIKGNMPNAVVALNHTTWLSNEQTNAYWDEMERQGVSYDLVWTTGVANNMGFLERTAKPGVYNEATATYAYVAKKTGRRIFVDTSFGLSGMSDTWATADAATLNERIADGVIAANVTMPPPSYVATVETLSSQLSSVCR